MIRKVLNLGLFASVLCLVHLAAYPATVSRTTKGQSVIQSGTNVRVKVAATGLYSQECYDAYYGCMDQFCNIDNTSGGTCSCSDENTKYEQQLASIKKQLDEANNIKTVEVEKIQAGAQADIIFKGERQYDEKGNILSVGKLTAAQEKEQKKNDLLAMFNDSYSEDEDVFENTYDDIANKIGNALYTAADDLCLSQMPESCTKDIVFLKQMYSRQIVSDCKAFENDIAKRQAAADEELANARSDVRAALKKSFDDANKYDRGTCMVEFKKCMQTEDACGKDWTNCVSTIASENMQNNKAASTAGTTVANVSKFDITDSTMEILDSKRNICEKVLNQCVAVRDMVWPDFLREAAPTIKVAELAAESNLRQSCLTDISKCIQKACKDDIVGKGVDTMDSCLSRPDMARSFCKVQIDSCERMEPLIWGYVKDKLAAMRVDACTQEVKDCFTSEDRCGKDFSNCIGMDYDYIHDICPIDKLVVCKANNPSFAMDDLDSMLMGLYLNIDNSALDNCQNLVNKKMAEVCGSTTDCNKFASDDTIGTGSLRAQKDDTIYRVTGMISFGSIKMGDSVGKTLDDGTKLEPGELGVQEYIANIRSKNSSISSSKGIISSIEEELNNISGTINRTIEMIEQDPEIQYCINGRDLSQITGKSGDKTVGRFPNLLNQIKMQIAIAALRQANDNYNKKLNAEISNATQNASIDLAQYMCQKIAESGGSGGGVGEASTPLVPPYSISYDVGSGLSTADLMKGGSGVLKTGGATFSDNGYLGGSKLTGGGMTKETSAIFSRDTRKCHICSTVSTENCKTTGSSSWFHNSKNTSCTTKAGETKCEDFQM
ncbi:MAG: hypothetical protein JW974_00190 [Alphaproteobacteria bacterium]|nr:hypothetical protein [Alphaproteobacteria bacterium]MBN2675065.1 hypothetical protein [Alphaproteobacteria bacterium]